MTDQSDTTGETDEQSARRQSAEEAAAVTGPAGARDTDSASTEQPGADQASVELATQQWSPLFPFDEPYPAQVAGINEFLSTLSDNGYYAVEGACGTGKTLIGLLGSIHAMQTGSITLDGDTTALPAFERTVAVTPVKQQLKQFIAEVRRVNRALPASAPYDSVDAIVLRGMSDVLVYTNAEGFDFDAESMRAFARADADILEAGSPSRRDQISQLRATTRQLIKAGSPIELDWAVTAPEVCTVEDCRHLVGAPQMAMCPFHTEASPEQDPPWADIVRAERVVELVEALPGDRLQVDGTTTPYPDRFPVIEDVVAYATETGAAHAQAPFDPFYAKASAGLGNVGFDDGAHRVLDRDALVTAAAADGSCPHVCMGTLARTAGVVIGNYNHLFDPQTRQLTAGKAGLFDEETILIIDEAHRVEGRVRDLLSDDLSPYTLMRVRNDLATALRIANGVYANGSTDQQQAAERTAETVLERVTDTGRALSADSLERAIAFTEWLIDTVGELVQTYLEDQYDYWTAAIGDGRPATDSFDLEDPAEPGRPDQLTQRLRQSDRFNPSYLELFETVCTAAAAIHTEADISTRETVCLEAGQTLARWHTADSVSHHREMVLEHSPHAQPPTQLPDWAESITARLHLFNTIPSDRVAAIYDEVGGGIVMSATLAPLEEYKQTAGLAPLEQPATDDLAGTPPAGTPIGESPVDSRPVVTRTYDLAFPAQHRASWILDLPSYTKRNRGAPTQEWGQMTPTRKQYARALGEIAGSHGNHLIAMPNYAEAEWAGEWLDARVDKPVYVDQSSGADETTALLGAFFQADHAVLITSSLGTVTEGIDYDGDKLHCATVVGVPYRNIATGRAQAIIESYDREVADGSQSGFDTAVGIPAVRKARQAIGRVIRGPAERGVRILLDERYAQTGKYGVGQYLSPAEADEFRTIDPDMLSFGFEQFWRSEE